MTNEQKKRTWWVTNEFWPKANEQHYAFKFKPDVKQYGETFEVVQKYEFENLQKEIKELKEEIDHWKKCFYILQDAKNENQ